MFFIETVEVKLILFLIFTISDLSGDAYDAIVIYSDDVDESDESEASEACHGTDDMIVAADTSSYTVLCKTMNYKANLRSQDINLL